MGDQFSNNKILANLAIGFAIVLCFFNIVGLIPLGAVWYKYVILAVGFAIYFTLLYIVLKEPIHKLDPKQMDAEDLE